MENSFMCSQIKLIQSSKVTSVSFSPNGEYLAFGSLNSTIGVYRVSIGELIKTLTGHSSPVWSVVFSPTGVWLASGSWDKTIGVWSVSSGERIKTLTGHSS